MRLAGKLKENKNLLLWAMSFLAFLLVFLFQEIINISTNTLGFMPDDLREMYFGSLMAGADWNGTVDSPHFSALSTVIYSVILNNTAQGPVFIWQILILITAFFRSVPALISARVAGKFFGIEPKAAFLLGILSALCLPGRATHMTSDVFVQFFLWCLIWLLLAHRREENALRRAILLVLIIADLYLTVFADIEMMILLPAVAVIFVIKSIREIKRRSVPFGGIAYFILCIGAGVTYFLLLDVYNDKMFTLDEAFGTYSGSFDHMFAALRGGLGLMSGAEGIKHFFDGFVSSFFELSVCTFAFFPFLILMTFDKRKGNDGEEATEAHDMGLLISVLSIGILLMDAVMSVSSDLVNDSDLFTTEGFAFLIGPVIFFSGVIVISKEPVSLIKRIAAPCIFLISEVYVFWSLISPILSEEVPNLALFFEYNDSPLLGFVYSDSILGVWFFMIFVLVAVCAIYYVSSGVMPYKETLCIFICLFAGTYLVSWLHFDSKYKEGDKIYESVNSIILFDHDNQGIFGRAVNVYYSGDESDASIVQYSLKGARVKVGVPDWNEQEFVVLTNDEPSKIGKEIDLEDVRFCKLDRERDEEYIYIKGNDNLVLFDSAGLELEDPLTEEMHALNRIYYVILGRFGAYPDLEFWSSQLFGGKFTLEQVVASFMTSEEYVNKGTTAEEDVLMLWRLYNDEDVYDNVVPAPSKRELNFWKGKFASGIPLMDILEGISKDSVVYK